MKKNGFYLIAALCIAVIPLFFTGCEDKKKDDSSIATENTTEILEEKKELREAEKEKNRTMVSSSEISDVTIKLGNANQQADMLTFKNNDTISLKSLPQNIVVLNFFTTWCPPCRAEIPYLSDLQKKYKHKIIVAGILADGPQNEAVLKTFEQQHHIDYFISNSKANKLFVSKVINALHLPENFNIPLTVIYKNGHYFTFYEGAVPIEMVDHDVAEALKQ